MNEIVLTTLNGRYTHTSLGLRYIYANLKELQSRTIIKEYVINEKIQDIAENILAENPKIIGIGVYIWNAKDVQELIEIIKKISPQTTIILGGPEVSHKPLRIDFNKADYIIEGEGEIPFYELCNNILNNINIAQKIFSPKLYDIKTLQLPYKFYTDFDIANRYIYIEASRGCQFSCEFCLSSIDKKVRNFNIEELLLELQILWDRGARNFKFIDRTFNLDIKLGNRLLDFFLSQNEHFTAHFEVIPDHFPEELKIRIKQFPPTSLQLEIGIQTLKKEIAKNIKRNLNISKIKENLKFLELETNAHIHLDLIIGLPGESCDSFGENLDYLCSLSNSEIQLGVLKKLSGTTINRHDEIYGMIYSDTPPYDILANDLIPFSKMQEMKRFARFWDLVYNSGNFTQTFQLLVKDKSVYETFYHFSNWIYSETYSTWQISLDRLSKLLFDYMSEIQGYKKEEIADLLVNDILKVGGRKLPSFLRSYSELTSSFDKQTLASKNKRQQKRVNEKLN